jgi:hypothetical protein
MVRQEVTGLRDHLLEGAALAHLVQVQMLMTVVFMAQDPDRSLDRVRALGALRRRMLTLRRPAPPSARGRHRKAWTPL